MERYYVKAMGLAAWLLGNDFPLISVEKTDKGYHLFWYENSQELQECIEKYYSNGDIQKLTRAQIKLKKLMFSKSAV